MLDVLVVGAGITGLTAAYELHRRGVRPVVLEASSRAGGLILTEQVDGCTIEAGPDSILASKPAGMDLIRELGLAAQVQQVRTPGAFVLRGHRLYRLPSPSLLGIPLTWRALAGYDLLPWHARLRMALEPRVPARTSGGDESVASFFRRRFGPDTVDLIAQPLLGGIHAGDIEQLSMASLFPRLLEIERTHGRVLLVPRPEGSGRPPFASLTGGMGSLVHTLEARLPPGTIRYDSPVERLESAPYGAVILAAPAHVAATLVRPIDAEAAELCARVPYVSTASVALTWPRRAIAHPLHGTGFVVARRHTDVRITACTWVSSKWEGRAPDDTVLLRAFIGGAHDPDVVSLTDEALVAIVRRDLGRVMGILAEPSQARVFRWRRAGAQHTVGHLSRVEEIERRLSGCGIFVAGSGFRSVGIPDCIADARRVAAEAVEFVSMPPVGPT
ncbi:MAG TPA: protoporphyrinogen oxidase [Vicinamibacterales bacterium]|nr:protoporphyrinogen oxidase [Vicinamibacterales bacterium]